MISQYVRNISILGATYQKLLIFYTLVVFFQYVQNKLTCFRVVAQLNSKRLFGVLSVWQTA